MRNSTSAPNPFLVLIGTKATSLPGREGFLAINTDDEELQQINIVDRNDNDQLINHYNAFLKEWNIPINDKKHTTEELERVLERLELSNKKNYTANEAKAIFLAMEFNMFRPELCNTTVDAEPNVSESTKRSWALFKMIDSLTESLGTLVQPIASRVEPIASISLKIAFFFISIAAAWQYYALASEERQVVIDSGSAENNFFFQEPDWYGAMSFTVNAALNLIFNMRSVDKVIHLLFHPQTAWKKSSWVDLIWIPLSLGFGILSTVPNISFNQDAFSGNIGFESKIVGLSSILSTLNQRLFSIYELPGTFLKAARPFWLPQWTRAWINGLKERTSTCLVDCLPNPMQMVINKGMSHVSSFLANPPQQILDDGEKLIHENSAILEHLIDLYLTNPEKFRRLSVYTELLEEKILNFLSLSGYVKDEEGEVKRKIRGLAKHRNAAFGDIVFAAYFSLILDIEAGKKASCSDYLCNMSPISCILSFSDWVLNILYGLGFTAAPFIADIITQGTSLALSEILEGIACFAISPFIVYFLSSANFYWESCGLSPMGLLGSDEGTWSMLLSLLSSPVGILSILSALPALALYMVSAMRFYSLTDERVTQFYHDFLYMFRSWAFNYRPEFGRVSFRELAQKVSSILLSMGIFGLGSWLIAFPSSAGFGKMAKDNLEGFFEVLEKTNPRYWTKILAQFALNYPNFESYFIESARFGALIVNYQSVVRTWLTFPWAWPLVHSLWADMLWPAAINCFARIMPKIGVLEHWVQPTAASPDLAHRGPLNHLADDDKKKACAEEIVHIMRATQKGTAPKVSEGKTWGSTLYGFSMWAVKAVEETAVLKPLVNTLSRSFQYV